MSTRNFNNTSQTGTLAGLTSSGATSLTATGFTGYPSVPFTITVSRGEVDEEIMLVTAAAGTVLTVTRGYNGTAAQTHQAGATVEHTAIALDFSEANTHVNAVTGVHGTTGTLVGTEASQTLLDKTLTSPVCEADTSAGDAIVAYVPVGAEARNLFRGMNPAGDDVALVNSSGQATFARVQSTGNSETDGNHQVDGNLIVGGTATVTGAFTFNGAVTIPAESASTSPVRKSTTDAMNTRLTTAETTLSGASSGNVTNALVKRDGAGRIAITSPLGTSDAATKGYADGLNTAMDTRVTTVESKRVRHATSNVRAFHGSAVASFSAVSFANAVIDYSSAGFTSPPIVVATPTSGATQAITGGFDTISSTSATFVAKSPTNITASVTINFIAMGV